MSELGTMSLLLAFALTAYAGVGSVVGARIQANDLIMSARRSSYMAGVSLAVAVGALVYAFVTHDFSIDYVRGHSDRTQDQALTWVAMYAGNEGSLLYITAIFTVMSMIAIYVSPKRLEPSRPYIIAILMGITLFFVGVMLTLADPFAPSPINNDRGIGVNPLLRHPGMFVHPPLQMAGLVGVAIPFSFVAGAMIAGQTRDQWLDAARVSAIAGWALLSAGLLIGAWWAYTILGWGGYWAWDPVENSALMPWLGMTAFVHSIMVQKRRGMFRMWNMVLIIVSFAMAQMGMFINRGGPVPSVHSFAESTMGWIFLAVMAATLFISLSIFIFRYDTLRSRSGLDSMISRESAFLAQNVLFLLIAFITLWGTIFPIFSEAVDDTTMTIGQPFFNKVNGPLMILLVLLMGIGPVLPWRKAGWTSVNKMLRAPFVVACGVLLLSLISGINQYWVLISFVVCSVPVTTVVQELVRGTRSRHSHGENWGLSFLSLLGANRPRYGGYIVHLSIVMLAIGITASSFYDVQKDVVMKPGDSEVLGKYTFTYIEVSEKSFPDRTEETAKFEVWSGDKYIGYMYPYRAVYPEFQLAATRGAIHSTIIEDFYLVPSEFMEDGQAVFRVLINPLVLWMWVSGPVLVLGTLVSISPNSRKHKKRVRLPSVNIDQNPLGMAK